MGKKKLFFHRSINKFFLFGLYGNLNIAFSVRKIVPDYKGYCMRVRRGSDNAELDIGFVSDELDVVSLLSFIGSSDGYVSIWYSQSEIEDNMFNSINENQPYIVESGVLNTKRGKPAIRVVRKTRWLHNSINKYSVYFSSYNVFSQGTDAAINSENTGSADTIFKGYSNMSFKFDTVSQVTFSGLSYDNSNSNLLSLIKASSFQELSVNADVYFKYETLFGWGKNGISTYYGAGYYQEIIGFTDVKETADSNGIKTNINNYYGFY